MENSRKDRASIQGRWHLFAAEYPEGEVPAHRVDFVFHDDPAGLRGAVLSRIDGREIPLYSVTVDGSELRLRMSVTPVRPDDEPPYLVMRAIADHFVGAWDGPGTKHIRLKLVRARNEQCDGA